MRHTLAALLTVAATPVLADAPRVVTDIPPVHALAAQVMGDLGAPVLLTERGANAHAMQLRPSQAAAIAGADVLVWIGPELTPWLDRALAGNPPRGTVVSLLAAPGTHRQDFGATAGGADPHEDHGDGHGHGDAHGHGHDKDHAHDHDHDHAHEGLDPHAWLDPANAKVWLAVIAAELSKADPANAAVYAANAAAAAAAVDALDAEVSAILDPVRDRPFVVFHDAYGYFAAHYGLRVAGSVALGDAATPGAARIAALREAIADSGAVCAFPEVQHDARLMTAATEGTGVRIGAALDPAGTSMDPGPGLYAALMRGMAQAIADCLKG